MSDERVFAKCAWRLIPFITVLYVVSYIDRVNVGFAALTMNKDLGFSPTVFGFGAGIFFFTYALCQLPANLMIQRVGPRRGIVCILLTWGAISAANAFVWSPASFYVLRFVLGIAEAGFFPGMIFYMTLWFPRAYLARCIAAFQTANPLAFVIGGPLSGLILGMEGTWSLHGWQWLFLLEGLPACLLALAVYRFMPDGPADASWLTSGEKDLMASRLAAEGAGAQRDLGPALRDPRVYGLGVGLIGIVFCINGLQLWLPQIVQAMGFSNTVVGFVVAVPFAFATAGMMLWGYSSDIRGERIWHVAIATLLAAAGLVAASASASYIVVLVGLSAAVIGQFAALPVINSLPPVFLRGAAAAGGIALYNTIGQLGGSFGSVVIGVLKQDTGGYAAGLLALAAGMVMSALIVLTLGRVMAPPRAAIAAVKTADA